MVWYDSRLGVILTVEIHWVKKSFNMLLLNEKIRYRYPTAKERLIVYAVFGKTVWSPAPK